MLNDFYPTSLSDLLHYTASGSPCTGSVSRHGVRLKGKTVTTLTAVQELKYNRFEVARILVIAPKKVAEATWSKEAQKWEHLKHLRVTPVLGSLTKRIKALNTVSDLYVINRENVTWLVDYYRNDWPFDMVVIDESSSFKNHKAKRFKSLCFVRSRISRIVELTGTPAPNGLLDLWAQIFLLDGGQRLGKSIGQYRERYFNPDQRSREMVYSYAPKAGAEEAVHKLLSDICISMSAEDYLTLPDLTSVIVPVVLDNRAQLAYQRLEEEMLLQVDEETIDAGSAAALTNKLLQLCNGAVYDSEKKAIPIHDCKLDAFMELVEALSGKSALVFYNFQHDKDRLLAALSKTGLRVRLFRCPQDEEDWNNRKIDILLAHPASTAYGLNLQDGGNHVIWFGLNWSLELYQQANKRLHRQGQTQKVIIHHLVTQGGMDDDVMAALENKSTTQEGLLNALKVRIERVKKSAK